MKRQQLSVTLAAAVRPRGPPCSQSTAEVLSLRVERVKDSLERQEGAGATATKRTRCQKRGAESSRKTGKHAGRRENSRRILKSRIPPCSALPLLALLNSLCTSVFYCDSSSGLI